MNDPREMIQELIDAGYSEVEVAQELNKENPKLGISQSTVNRIKNGKQSARFDVGQSLVLIRGRLLPKPSGGELAGSIARKTG